MHAPADSDTIAAIATPPGRGGVAVLRLSGPRAMELAAEVAGRLPPRRRAALRPLRNAQGEIIDRALVLAFPGPGSFTGEDVVEFQLHGSPVIAALLLQRIISLGAREAGPGEFTKRAFLNGRMDLAQAEAVADLVASASSAAARAAMRSLEGEFSAAVHGLTEAVTLLRARLEAGLDFPEEGLDAFSDPSLAGELQHLLERLGELRAAADRGRVLRDGLTLVIAGAPNAGKSSLLNCLAGYEAAIVTELPGTTRDLVREEVLVDGMPVRVVDTAGLRDSADRVEAEGIRRAREAMRRADLVLLVHEGDAPDEQALRLALPDDIPVLRVRNKIDLAGLEPGMARDPAGGEVLRLSALTGAGVDVLRTRLKEVAGYADGTDGNFAARRRHLDALDRAGARMREAGVLLQRGEAIELAAEELRLAQQALAEITGEFTTEDLLGRIFSEFCIGK